MEILSMYKEMDITIKELEAALFRLGFVKTLKMRQFDCRPLKNTRRLAN